MILTRGPTIRLWSACVVLGIALLPAAVRAQERSPPTFRLDGAFGFMSDFPPALDDGCRERGASVGVRAHYRAHRLFSIEAGVGSHVSIIDEERTECGGFIFPSPPGVTVERTGYMGERSNSAIVPEMRFVLTPVSNAGGSLRLIGGTGWYMGRGTPAWLVGAGVRFNTRRSSVILEVERWNAGVPTRTFRVTGVANGPDIVERVGSDRDWFRWIHYRIGFSVWTR